MCVGVRRPGVQRQTVMGCEGHAVGLPSERGVGDGGRNAGERASPRGGGDHRDVGQAAGARGHVHAHPHFSSAAGRQRERAGVQQRRPALAAGGQTDVEGIRPGAGVGQAMGVGERRRRRDRLVVVRREGQARREDGGGIPHTDGICTGYGDGGDHRRISHPGRARRDSHAHAHVLGFAIDQREWPRIKQGRPAL